MMSTYFTIENFPNLNVWPCPGTLSMNMFDSAGYATFSGHLTALSYSLLDTQYYPYEMASQIWYPWNTSC